MILNFGEASLKQIVDECVSVLIFKAQSKGLNLFIDLGEYENFDFQTDKNRLVQILVNLISNAIKYTNEGHVKVVGKKEEGNLIISVIDTGVGIPQEKLTQLFTPFNKILNNRDLNKEGVGLGLTISKNLA